jgi:putative membrane protein
MTKVQTKSRGKTMKPFFGAGLKSFLCLIGVLSLKSTALAEYNYRGNGGWGMGPGMMGWAAGTWFGSLFMLLFWVLLILLIVLVIRRLFASGASGSPGRDREESALDILKKRYARGEIDKEFETKKKDLS